MKRYQKHSRKDIKNIRENISEILRKKVKNKIKVNVPKLKKY